MCSLSSGRASLHFTSHHTTCPFSPFVCKDGAAGWHSRETLPPPPFASTALPPFQTTGSRCLQQRASVWQHQKTNEIFRNLVRMFAKVGWLQPEKKRRRRESYCHHCVSNGTTVNDLSSTKLLKMCKWFDLTLTGFVWKKIWICHWCLSWKGDILTEGKLSGLLLEPTCYLTAQKSRESKKNSILKI